MQSETDWLLAPNDPADETPYQYFMRPEPREGMGPIVKIEDKILGETRVRTMEVGMTRNAATKKEMLVYLDPLPHIRLTTAKPLQGWYKAKDDYIRGQRPRPCFTDAILTEPYGGYCTVGCSFCYVNSGFRGYRGTGLISVPVNYGDLIAADLARLNTAAAGYFSSFTDPFLSVENFYHNTQRGAETFDRAGLPVFFLSRLSYPGWAIDLLTRNRFSYAQKSLNTGDPDDYKKFSPAALGLDEHIEEVRELRRRGIYTSIQVNPILPGITSHEDIRLLFDKLAAAGNNHVIVKFVEAGYSWAPTMVERTAKRFGANRVTAFRDLFVDNIGGQKTVAEAYRLEAHELYRKWATERKMTYATCYEYKYKRDAAGNIKSKLGVSIGREFTTAEQCHGQRVPMHTRPWPGGKFVPVEECPPSGCLYCAEENLDVPRCGSTTFGAATALRTSDLKKPVKPFL